MGKVGTVGSGEWDLHAAKGWSGDLQQAAEVMDALEELGRWVSLLGERKCEVELLLRCEYQVLATVRRLQFNAHAIRVHASRTASAWCCNLEHRGLSIPSMTRCEGSLFAGVSTKQSDSQSCC